MSDEELEYVKHQFDIIKLKIDFLSSDLRKMALAVENFALQTTNNQVETKKTLDAIKLGVLDTNLAVKYPNTK